LRTRIAPAYDWPAPVESERQPAGTGCCCVLRAGITGIASAPKTRPRSSRLSPKHSRTSRPTAPRTCPLPGRTRAAAAQGRGRAHRAPREHAAAQRRFARPARPDVKAIPVARATRGVAISLHPKPSPPSGSAPGGLSSRRSSRLRPVAHAVTGQDPEARIALYLDARDAKPLAVLREQIFEMAQDIFGNSPRLGVAHVYSTPTHSMPSPRYCLALSRRHPSSSGSAKLGLVACRIWSRPAFSPPTACAVGVSPGEWCAKIAEVSASFLDVPLVSAHG